MLCNVGIAVIALYNCCIKPETEEKPEIFLFWLSSSSDPSKLDHFVPLTKESFGSQTSEGSLSRGQTRPLLGDDNNLEFSCHNYKASL